MPALAISVGGDTAEVHPAGVVLDEHQDIQPVQQNGTGVEEVDGGIPAA